MKFSQHFSAQRIIKQILDWINISKSDAILERVSDSWTDGVAENILNNMLILGKDSDPTLTDFFHITVDTGVAYKTGERILIDLPNVTYDLTNVSDTTNDGLGNLLPTPHSTGSFDIPLTAGSINYVYIAYLLTTDETQFTLNKITNAKQFYKRTDGYEITVNLTGINPDSTRFIFLGQIDLTGINQAISSNISIVDRDKFRTQLNRVQIQTPNIGLTDRPATYNVGNNSFFLDDHIKSVGTGTITPFNAHGLTLNDIGVGASDTVSFHRINEHVNGLIAGTNSNPYPITSAMFCQRVVVSPGDDFLTVKAFSSGELAIITGQVFSIAEFGLDVNVAFTGFPAGTYNVYFDSVTGLIDKTTGSIATDLTKLWLCTTTWDPTLPLDGNLSVPFDRRRFGTMNLLQRWVTSGRPPNPISGTHGFNLDVSKLEYFNGTVWVALP